MADRDYTIVGPDGRELTITGPANATAEQLRSAAERAFGAQPAQPAPQAAEPSIGSRIAQQVGNVAAGAVRGAGSIGSTILGARDAVEQGIASLMGATEKGYVAGRPNRRAEIDAGLQQMGAQTDSLGYGAGKLASEVAGTLGVGGALAGGARAVGAAPTIVNALGSSGMQGGNVLSRIAGGAATGAGAAGLVNPEDAGTGAIIGGALPPALMAAGKAGNVVGRALRGPEQSPQMAQAVKSAQELGLVIPPTQAKASLGNRLLEGTAGKLTTAQNASVKNSAKVKEIAAQALGLPSDTQLTPEVLGQVKKAAGVLYDAVSNAGVVTPGKAYTAALDDIAAPHMKAMAGFPNAKPSPVLGMIDSLRSEAFDAASAVAKIKELRSAADDAFKPGGQGADIGRAAKKAAKALEDALDEHLQKIGEPDLLEKFRNARTLYAKTMTVDKALDKASGTVDARKLAAELQKGKPLSGDLRKVAEAAGQFKTAFKTPEQMGSLPQFSPLDLYGSAGLAGIGGAVTGNPLSALALGLPLLRTGARNAALSPRVQAGLVQRPTNPLRLISPGVEQFGYRAAPVIAADQ